MPDLRDQFNHRAATWDQNTAYNTDIIRTMLLLSDIRPHAVILDVGCGTGFLEPYLLRFQPKRILAVDFAEKMIEIARRKIEDRRVEFSCTDFFHVSSADIQCDYCFFYAVFPYFPEPKRMLRHVRSLMKQGARLTICHTQGKKSEAADYELMLPVLPAEGLIKLLQPYFRLDVIIDNNVMFMVSGCKIK